MWPLNDLNFLANFWGGLLSSVIVATIFSIVYPRYIDWLKRPKKIIFCFNETGTDTLKLSGVGDEYEYSFQLFIKHHKGVSLKDGIYWHLYIPTNTNPTVAPISIGTLPRQAVSINFVHLFGFVDPPIYSDTTRLLFYEFKGKFKKSELPNNNQIQLKYFFSTEYGKYPVSIKETSVGKFDVNSMLNLYLSADKDTSFK